MAKSFNLLSSNPVAGDTITTRQFIDELKADATVVLKKGTEYYAVNDQLVGCDSKPLNKSFNAVFIRQFEAKCDGDFSSPLLAYTVFRLL
jgi:hypothetical protein